MCATQSVQGVRCRLGSQYCWRRFVDLLQRYVISRAVQSCGLHKLHARLLASLLMVRAAAANPLGWMLADAVVLEDIWAPTPGRGNVWPYCREASTVFGAPGRKTTWCSGLGSFLSASRIVYSYDLAAQRLRLCAKQNNHLCSHSNNSVHTFFSKQGCTPPCTSAHYWTHYWTLVATGTRIVAPHIASLPHGAAVVLLLHALAQDAAHLQLMHRGMAHKYRL